ncbi:MAG: transglycosylase SLT domain-containing protein [Rhodocyclaceae bacterium]|nr:transglycosylase SLT domain-containing protein [Rhodocyclaceae bacterium]
MPIADLPPMMQERVVCSIAAAARYDIPAHVLLAVAEQEGGKPGQWVRNSNGTWDVGAMQFNTAYLRELAQYGIRAEHVAASGCYAYNLAAWRLRMHIRKDEGDLWTKAANYHSRTPYYNSIYRAAIERRGAKWATWLEARLAAPRAAQTVAPPAAEQPQGGAVFGARFSVAASSANVGVVTSPSPALPVATIQTPVQPPPTPGAWPPTDQQGWTGVSVGAVSSYVPRTITVSQ